MKKSFEFGVKRLAKLMAYILGHRPDEFGLVLDREGFVSLKELHRAISEEEGWSHVRMINLEEAAHSSEGARFEIRDGRIRIWEGDAAPLPETSGPVEPPPVLYYAARRKAYEHILQHGLEPVGKPFVSLAATEALAFRMGRRRDAEPVLLTIHARRAYEGGCTFTCAQELIYLAGSLPMSYISGPPLERVAKTLPQKEKKPEKPLREVRSPAIPGYDSLRMAYMKEAEPKKKRENDSSWKESARKFRRRRQRGER